MTWLSRKSLVQSSQLTYATFDTINKHPSLSLSNGDLTVSASIAAWSSVFFSIQKTSGIWAVEFSVNAGSDPNGSPGLGGISTSLADTNTYLGSRANYSAGSYAIFNGRLRFNAGATDNFFDDFTVANAQNVLCVFDFDQRKMAQIKGGSLAYTNQIGTTEPLYIGTSLYGVPSSLTVNCGQTPFTALNKSLLPVGCNEGLWE